MKRILITATAICLAACSKQEIAVRAPEPEGMENGYVLTLTGPGIATKADGSISEVNFYLADMENNYCVSRQLTATLFKKSGGNWQKVTEADYEWTDPGSEYYRYRNDIENHMYHHLDAVMEGSGVKLTASGLIEGRTVAVSEPVEVIVNDNRRLEWTSCDTSLDGGETGTAVLTSNFSGSVIIKATNGILIGNTANPASSSTMVEFDSGHRSRTLYYKYEGTVPVSSLVTAVSEMDAVFQDSFNLDAEPKVYHYKVSFNVGAKFPLDADQIDFFNEFRRLYPLDDEDYRYFWNETQWTYKFAVGADDQPATEKTIQGSMTLSFDSNFRIDTSSGSGIIVEFDSFESSETVYVNLQTCSFGNTSFFYSYDMSTFYKYYDSDFFNNRTYGIAAGNDSVDGVLIRNNSIYNNDYTQAHPRVSPGNSSITLYLDLP